MTKLKLDITQSALSLGILSAVLHGFWVLIVGAGLGMQNLMAMERMHFAMNGLSTMQFGGFMALVGIIGAFIIGFLIGGLFAVIWNWLNKQL